LLTLGVEANGNGVRDKGAIGGKTAEEGIEDTEAVEAVPDILGLGGNLLRLANDDLTF
jgi:hypothetical protein